MAEKSKKGYAYRKALEIIAWERGSRKEKPRMPSSRAKRGAIARWKKEILKGGKSVPTTGEMGGVVKRKIKTEGLMIRIRVGVTISVGYQVTDEDVDPAEYEFMELPWKREVTDFQYSGSINQSIPETLVSVAQDWKTKYKGSRTGMTGGKKDKYSPKLAEVYEVSDLDCQYWIIREIGEIAQSNIMLHKWDFDYWQEEIDILISEEEYCDIKIKIKPINRIKVDL